MKEEQGPAIAGDTMGKQAGMPCVGPMVGSLLPFLLILALGGSPSGTTARSGGLLAGKSSTGTPRAWDRLVPLVCPTLALRGGGDDVGDTKADEEEGSAMEDHRGDGIPWVRIRLYNTCFGRSDFINVVVDSEMLVRDFKADMQRNFTSAVCDPDQMELWCRGQELIGFASDQLSDYGIEPGGPEKGFFTASLKQNYIHTEAGEGTKENEQTLGPEGIQALLQSPMMMQLLADPPMLQSVIQHHPQFKQLLAANPELRKILEDPELLQKALKGNHVYDDEYNEEGFAMNPPEESEYPRYVSKEQEALERVRRVSTLATKRDRELAMQDLPPEQRAAVERAVGRIEKQKIGWDRTRLKETLKANASLAAEYAELFRRHGSVEAIRTNISSSLSSTLLYPELAATLSCAYEPPAPPLPPRPTHPDAKTISTDLLQDALRTAYEEGGGEGEGASGWREPMSLPSSARGLASDRSLSAVEAASCVTSESTRARENLAKLDPAVLREAVSLMQEMGSEGIMNDPAKMEELEKRLSERPDLSKVLVDMLQASEGAPPLVSEPPSSLASMPAASAISRSPPPSIHPPEARPLGSKPEVEAGSKAVMSRAQNLSNAEARALGTRLIKSGDVAMKRRDFAGAAADFESAMRHLGATEGHGSATVAKLAGLVKAAKAKARDLQSPVAEEQDLDPGGEVKNGVDDEDGDAELPWIPPPPPPNMKPENSWHPNPPNSGMSDDEWKRYMSCKLWVKGKIEAVHLARDIIRESKKNAEVEALIADTTMIINTAQLNETMLEEMYNGTLPLPYEEWEFEEIEMASTPEPEEPLPVAEACLEEKYGDRVKQLVEMGFPDYDANLRALVETGGSVENAVNRLLR